MVAKDIFPFGNATDNFKEVFFKKFFNIFFFLVKLLKKLCPKCSWENPIKLFSLQPSVTVSNGKIPFATMTHGCKDVTYKHVLYNFLF